MTVMPTIEAQAKRGRRRPCKHTVLWVDDDPNIVAASYRRMQRHSIHVIPANDGMQGYWYALTRKPDAIVTDLRMPRWEGQDLLNCLMTNSATRGVPTVLLSGYLSDLPRRHIDTSNVVAVLEKPVDLRVLLEVLHKCWEGD